MQIREAVESDMPEIVSVLKASLGEDDLALSEETWRYKHLENPFGKSIVLVGVEHNRIIGVRAFMRWEWKSMNKIYHALRAVDTATHPDHQGKGVFKKLTLKAVDIGKRSSDNFIFNTPNVQSRPGYLKMGWVPAGKLRVSLRPSLYYSFRKISNENSEYRCRYFTDNEELSKLCESWNVVLDLKELLYTPKTVEFLKWRYEYNPLQSYEVRATSDYYIAGYIKRRKYFNEFRISELIFKEDFCVNKIMRIIREMSRRFPVHIISYSPQLLDSVPISIKGKFGPILTVRHLNLSKEEQEYLINLNNWAYSLGDLELF